VRGVLLNDALVVSALVEGQPIVGALLLVELINHDVWMSNRFS